MPVSRSESKRKRRNEDNIVDCLSDSPKRTKVHAQRKFAQGAALIPPILSSFKDLEKEKSKPVDTTPTELLPSKRPNTEDFLTFLCFRGTSILPPNLDFFNSASQNEAAESPDKNDTTEKTTPTDSTAVVTSPNQPPDRPFVAFGVRKRADPFIHSRLDRKRRRALTVQVLRRKYQEQRLAKLRAIKLSTMTKEYEDGCVKTRSSAKKQPAPVVKKVVKKAPVHPTKHTVIVKRPMLLRSGGRIVAKDLMISHKKKPPKVAQTKIKSGTSSEYSSDDDQPLVKTVTKLKRIPRGTKVAKKSASVVVTKAPIRQKTVFVMSRKTNAPKRCTRSNSTVEPLKQPQRPSRKTKEAAALYMELLGRKLVQDAEVDEDTLSIDSYPELPNVKRAEQRENEIRAQNKSSSRIVTRNSVDNKSKIRVESKVKVKSPSKSVSDKLQANDSTNSKENFSKCKENVGNDNIKAKSTPEGKSITQTNSIERRITREIQRKQNHTSNQSVEYPKTRHAEKINVERLKRKPVMKTQEIVLRSKTISTQSSVIKSKAIKPKISNDNKEICKSKDVNNSNEGSSNKKSIQKNVVVKKLSTNTLTNSLPNVADKVDVKVEHDFNDSDEEPLASKLKSESTEPCVVKINNAQNIQKINTQMKIAKIPIIKSAEIKSQSVKAVKVESVTVKKNELDLTFPLSDDDDEKAFRGFITSDSKGFLLQEKCSISNCNSSRKNVADTSSSDLLCKDIGRRFGKEKVNMSNEQIEKWLNDADQELKKEISEKRTLHDDTFIAKSDFSDTCETKPNTPNISKNTPPSETVNKIEKSRSASTEKRSIFQQRRPIINKTKEQKQKPSNANAFSPDNESSVYAFEAETETPISTPFRRHSRRPSSTTTSKSEDEVGKLAVEDDVKKSPIKFRVPSMLKHDEMKTNTNQNQVSLTLGGTDDSSNQCASISVQVNLSGNLGEQVGLTPNMECSTTDLVDDGESRLFYIPLQTGKQSVSDQQVIQGVAVKLGTAGPNGPNQRVIMQAKLVTKPSTAQGLFGNKSLLPPQPRTSTSMYPPVGTVQPFRPKPSEAVKPIPKSDVKIISENSQSSDELKIERFKSVPTSPSASSSSSARLNKRVIKTKPRILETPTSSVSTVFPSLAGPAQVVEAPTFHPTEKEFQDPLEYIDKIRPMAESFGLCRIVPPPGFKPECKVSDDMRFTAYNQYVHKMLYRWGPNFRELTAIKKYLATQNIVLTQAPWIGGMEVDLPRLYQTVQSLGGLKEVIEKKRWPKVAELMRIPKSAQDRVTKLDDIYCKYLLPYDTLSQEERQKLLNEVDAEWEKRQSKPPPSGSNADDSEAESEDGEDTECIVRGRSMALNAFYRIARNTMSMWFKTNEPPVIEVEQEFWKHVNAKSHHLCVHCGSIDSGGYGYGFACSKNSPFARHPWNLKVLTNNTGSILRSMGPIMGVTVPTLHVGMVFSACCWYRDPHGLPWIEYLHTGANKVWYGIPDSLNASFRQTLNKLVPNLCRNTSVWLPSDTAMVPPSLLVSNNVSLCRTVQEPGQYIIIFPKAFTSSLCTGYTVSESVFFAQTSWLDNSEQIFSELKESCEPSMFSLERLLLSMASDSRCSVDILKRILPGIQNIRDKESVGRDKLRQLGVAVTERLPQSNKKRKKADTDGEYLCEVCKSNLFVSLVTETQDDEVYCLLHAMEYVSTNKISTKDCKLMYTYTENELCEIVDKVITTIDIKTQKKASKSTN